MVLDDTGVGMVVAVFAVISVWTLLVHLFFSRLCVFYFMCKLAYICSAAI